jgi:hypothetical protein
MPKCSIAHSARGGLCDDRAMDIVAYLARIGYQGRRDEYELVQFTATPDAN